MLLICSPDRMVTGVVFESCVFSPLVTLLQGALSARTIQSLEAELLERHEEFLLYYKGPWVGVLLVLACAACCGSLPPCPWLRARQWFALDTYTFSPTISRTQWQRRR
jgi:hypothetical protein